MNALEHVHRDSGSARTTAREFSRGSSTVSASILGCIPGLVASAAAAGLSVIFAGASLLRLPNILTAAGSGRRAAAGGGHRAAAGSGRLAAARISRRATAGSGCPDTGADVLISGGRISGGGLCPRYEAGSVHLDLYVVQTGCSLRCEDCEGYYENPSRMQHDMKTSRAEAKQALNVLVHGLLQAAENTLLLRRGLRVGGNQKSNSKIKPVNQVIKKRASNPIDS